jgi:diguanylate cyclase (GGDEF)-like protein
MSDSPSPQPEDAFSLFETEERMLLDAEVMIRHLHGVAQGVEKLAGAYRRSLKEQQRLVRLSDRMQHELQTTKAEIAAQAANLRALNTDLRLEAEQRLRLSEELFRIATTDQLTGAVSRRHLFELGNHEMAKAARSGDPVTAMLVDLDHFKQINDTYGHMVGDEVLKAFAEITRTVVRATDIFARFGGEEFVILLPDTPERGGMESAERLRATLAERPIRIGGDEIAVTVSIGLAAVTKGDANLEHLLARADRALYRAKRSGRNRVVVAPPLDGALEEQVA